jgi:hypothetical protein
LPLCRRALRRWLPLLSLGLMLTCGTGTGTSNAALPEDPAPCGSTVPGCQG